MTIQEVLKKIFTKTATEEDKQYYVDNFMSDEEKNIGKPFYEMSRNEELQYQASLYNHKKGDLQGYNCPKCMNRGDFQIVKYIGDEGYIAHKECDCWSIRNTIKRMEDSGLGNLLDLYSFKNYKCAEEWQRDIFNKAQAFLEADTKWFYIGGASGSGKTMICTAIVRELLKQGKSVKYMLWNDESLELKQCVTDNDKYAMKINILKNSQVLYIDDFFKIEKGSTPSPADIKLAFEILNYRYNKARIEKDKRYITIISSEKSIEDLLDIDEALGSRIYEMTKPNYYTYIPNDGKRNYRLK